LIHWTLLASTSLAVPAMVAAVPQEEAPKVRATLVAEHETVAPGQTAWVGVQMEIEKGWHTYWNGRNQTGTPPIIKWKLPEGFKAGDIQWPGPTRYIAYDSLDHIHEGRVLLMVPIEVPASAKPGSRVELSAQCMFVVCKEVCLMERASPSLTLAIAQPNGTPKPTPAAKDFEKARAALPVPLAKAEGVKARVEKGVLVIEAPDAQRVSFFPAEDSAETPEILTQGEAKGPTLRVTLVPTPQARRVKGVAAVLRKDSKQPTFVTIDLDVSR
jgi:DsbC/DsbD-like thiol-disulfide interchange protein